MLLLRHLIKSVIKIAGLKRHIRKLHFSEDWSSSITWKLKPQLICLINHSNMNNTTGRSGQDLSTGGPKQITGLVIMIWQKMIMSYLWDYRSEERRVGKECRSRW